MARIPTSFSSTPSNSAFNATDAINDIDLGTFLKLMIAELQHQDPLNPMDNKDMLAQISQIREVGATDKLTQTLESVLLGQNITSATNLIGAEIEGLSDDNQKVTGMVQQISISGGQPKLHLTLPTTAAPSLDDGNVEPGVYSYRVVWEGDNGRLKGVTLSADTTGNGDKYKSIRLAHLPASSSPKQIYRDDEGNGQYRLVATLNDGSQSSYHDKLSSEERSQTRQTLPFDAWGKFRNFDVALDNVATIRPTRSLPSIPDDEEQSGDEP
ncbi:MAG: flagellar hook capping FlgD N-terminal domain-containing protein [Pirellulales bacterium]